MASESGSLEDTRRVCLADVYRLALDAVSKQLQTLLEEAGQRDSTYRSQALLRFIHDTQQRLLRLRVVASKAALLKHKAASRAVSWLGTLTRHATALHQAPEHLFHAHHALATQLPVPLFDVASAWEVATSGRLQLPAFVSDLASNNVPAPARRAQLVAECNALTLHLLHSADMPAGMELLEVSNGVAMLAGRGDYEVALLLEPAPPPPLEAIIESLLPLLARSVPSAEALNAKDDPADVSSGLSSTAVSPAEALAGAAVKHEDGTDGLAPSREQLRAALAGLGFQSDALAHPQLRWRWRLVNIAVCAGSSGTHRMTGAQLHYLRAELDFRMLHMRHAAVVRHCLRKLREQGDVAAPSHPAGAYAGADSDGADAGMHGVADAAPAKGEGMERAASEDSAALSAVAGFAHQGGTVAQCLAQEHSTFLGAALSAPLAIAHATLHDIAASQAFRAACASSAELARSTSSAWRGKLRATHRVRQLRHGLRVELWPDCALMRSCGADARLAVKPDRGVARSSGSMAEQGPDAATGADAQQALQPQRAFAAAVEVGIRGGSFAVAVDPPLAQLWQEASIEEQAGLPAPADLALDPVTGDLEAVLHAAAAHVALVQLAQIRRALLAALLAQGWQPQDLGLSLWLRSLSAAPALVPPGESGVARSEAPANSLLEQLQAAASEANAGAGGSSSSSSSPVPALLLCVSEHLVLGLTVDVASGELALVPAPSREAEPDRDAVAACQRQLRDTQASYATPSAAHPAHETEAQAVAAVLANFCVPHVLLQHTQACTRALSAADVRPEPQSSVVPTMLAHSQVWSQQQQQSSAQSHASEMPGSAHFYLVSSAPPSATLWAHLLAQAGDAPLAGLATARDNAIPDSRHLHSRVYLVVGWADSTGSTQLWTPVAHSTAAGSATAGRGTLQLRVSLMTCIADSLGRVRLVMGLQAVPGTAASVAQSLCAAGVAPSAMLQELQALAEPAASVHMWDAQQADDVMAQATQSSKRARQSDAGAELLPHKAARAAQHAPGTTAGIQSHPIAVTEEGAAAGNGAPVAGDAQDLHAHSQDQDAQEMLVACAFAWARQHALVQHLRLELEAAGVQYTEHVGGASGQRESAAARVGGAAGHNGDAALLAHAAAQSLASQTAFQLRTLPASSGESVNVPNAAAHHAAESACETGLGQGSLVAVQVGQTGLDSWRTQVAVPGVPVHVQMSASSWQRGSPVDGCIEQCCALQQRSVAQCWQAPAALLLWQRICGDVAAAAEADSHVAATTTVAGAGSMSQAPACVHFQRPAADVQVQMIQIDTVTVRALSRHSTPGQEAAEASESRTVAQLHLTPGAAHCLTQHCSNSAAPAPGGTALPHWTGLHSYCSLQAQTQSPLPQEVAELYAGLLRQHGVASFVDAFAATCVGQGEAFKAAADYSVLQGTFATQRIRIRQTGDPHSIVLVYSWPSDAAAVHHAGQGNAEYACGVSLQRSGSATITFNLAAPAAQSTARGNSASAGQASAANTRQATHLKEFPNKTQLVQELLQTCTDTIANHNVGSRPHEVQITQGRLGLVVSKIAEVEQELWSKAASQNAMGA